MNIQNCILRDDSLENVVGGYNGYFGLPGTYAWCQACEMNGDWPCLRPSCSYFPSAPCMRLENSSGQFVYPSDDSKG